MPKYITNKEFNSEKDFHEDVTFRDDYNNCNFNQIAPIFSGISSRVQNSYFWGLSLWGNKPIDFNFKNCILDDCIISGLYFKALTGKSNSFQNCVIYDERDYFVNGNDSRYLSLKDRETGEVIEVEKSFEDMENILVDRDSISTWTQKKRGK